MAQDSYSEPFWTWLRFYSCRMHYAHWLRSMCLYCTLYVLYVHCTVHEAHNLKRVNCTAVGVANLRCRIAQTRMLSCLDTKSWSAIFSLGRTWSRQGERHKNNRRFWFGWQIAKQTGLFSYVKPPSFPFQNLNIS